MGINLDHILESLSDGFKERFNKKSKEAYTEAKETVQDSSVFETRENFIEHYSDEIFGTNVESMPLDEFTKLDKVSENLEEDDAGEFRSLVDRNADELLSRDEAKLLLATVYDHAEEAEAQTQAANSNTQNSELYEKVTVQPWGSGEDDCLSRIVQKHVPEIELYSDDYNQYLNEICSLNGIENPNIVDGDIKLPQMKLNDDGSIVKDADGNIQFYSEEELRAKNGEILTADTNIETINNADGTVTTVVKDASGNTTEETVMKDDMLVSKKMYNYENETLASTIESKFENNEEVERTETKADGSLTKAVVDPSTGDITFEKKDALGNLTESGVKNSQGQMKSQRVYDENGSTETEYDNNNEEPTKIIRYDTAGNKTNSTMYEYSNEGQLLSSEILNAEGKITSLTHYKYDKSGDISESKMVRYNNGKQLPGYQISTYDKNGYEIQMAQYNDEGKTGTVEYQRDDKGRVTKNIQRGSKDNTLATWEYKYNADGTYHLIQRDANNAILDEGNYTAKGEKIIEA